MLRSRRAAVPADFDPVMFPQTMIGLDTSVLARYYIDDEADAEAQRQGLAACRLIESGQPLMVSKSVLLQFEWVMRGYYGFDLAPEFRIA